MKWSFIFLLTALLCLNSRKTYAQHSVLDSLLINADTSAVMDSLMKDFDRFLDSISKPKSFFSVSMGVGSGFFNFKSGNVVQLEAEKKAIFSPSVGYFHKIGLGIMVNGYMINEGGKMNMYQYSVTPSFDYIKNRNFSTGIAYSLYKTKKETNFYVTPIENEMFAYFRYKKWWLQPAVSLSYGWGSRTEYKEKQWEILSQRYRNNGGRHAVYIRQDESVSDFAVMTSVRHDFDWYGILGKHDNFVITPVLLLTSGTSNFGFNTSYSTNFNVINNNFLPSNSNITDKTSFEPKSTTLIVRSCYSVGSFFVMPQVLFDYYLHTADKRFNVVYAVMAGVNF